MRTMCIDAGRLSVIILYRSVLHIHFICNGVIFIFIQSPTNSVVQNVKT